MEALAPQADANSNRSWEKTATRDAILVAARKIAERDGILEMSLSAVATEAGFAPTSVYANFGSKNDLLVAVVADDLGRLARAMHGAFDRADEDEPEKAQASASLPHSELRRHPAGTTDAMAQVAAPVRDNAASHENAPAAADVIARLQQTVARLEKRPVDAWLERRLRELERSLSTIEVRRVESSTVEQSVEERFRDLGQSLEGLEHRLLATAEDTAQRFSKSLDACENRLRQLLSDTHGDAAALARRLTAIENAAFAAKPDYFVAAEESIAEPGTASAPESASAPDEGANAEPIVAAAAAPTPYLEAARKSAQAAAQAQVVRVRKKSRRSSETMVYLTMGSLFLFVAMLTAMGLLLRNQALDDKSAAAKPPAQTSVSDNGRRRIASGRIDPEARLRKLAQAGNPAAELLIGMNYLGSSQGKNDGVAFAWVARAATRNQPLAEYQLGLMYQKGLGVRADPAQAFHWFESAALQGNRKAMHALATCYAEGWGTQKNFTEAARWFTRAAALGSVNDQFNLGVLYERGMGVPQSLVDAYRWYATAAAAGDQESQARIAALASTLSPEDLAAARGAADSFKPDPLSAAANIPPDPARLR
ncbi:MAG TPA: TetR family transcriptional regulator [Rhizomicrobium sp.]|jgi:TPR repeat protein/AcrR family transcriptional regulator